MSADKPKAQAYEAGKLFKEMQKQLESAAARASNPVDRDFASQIAKGMGIVAGAANNSNDKTMMSFLGDDRRTELAGLPRGMVREMAQHYESFRLGILSPDEYAQQIRGGLKEDLANHRSLHSGMSARILASQKNMQANAAKKPASAGVPASDGVGAAAPPKPPASADEIVRQQNERARAQLGAMDIQAATGRPIGEAAKIHAGMQPHRDAARASLSALTDSIKAGEESGGLRGVFKKLAEGGKPRGGVTGLVVTAGLAAMASLLQSSPAEAAPASESAVSPAVDPAVGPEVRPLLRPVGHKPAGP